MPPKHWQFWGRQSFSVSPCFSCFPDTDSVASEMTCITFPEVQPFCPRDQEWRDKGFPCVQQQTATSYWWEITDPFHSGNKFSKSAGWREYLSMRVAHGASTEPWSLWHTCPVCPQSSDPILVSLTHFVNGNEGKGPSPCARFPFTPSPHLHAGTAWFQLVIDTKLSKWIFTTKPLSNFCFSSISFFTDCHQNCSLPKRKEIRIDFTELRQKHWRRSKKLFTNPRSANCLCLNQWLNPSGKFSTKLHPQSRIFRFFTERLWLPMPLCCFGEYFLWNILIF